MAANVVQGRAWIEYIKQFKDEVIPVIKLKRIQYRIEKEVLEKGCTTNRMHVENLERKNSQSD